MLYRTLLDQKPSRCWTRSVEGKGDREQPVKNKAKDQAESSSLTRLQRKLQHREMGRILPWLSEGKKSNSHQIWILLSVNRTGILGKPNRQHRLQ
uniref:Uncharacterized protein n=1 Tax=Utricularia reniformis TaxID=192314 RepID=A0A1Y0B246_9LAMI|nr:hypothetical protein AEK19_MT1311 [Utricularia reniformis]ART31512.1 hypothetical protein AEK19_MT1311 [Utricularia reniformis]